MLARSPEQRKAIRRPARRAATVSFAETATPVTCVIWDISEGGARLAIAQPIADLPRHFVLNLYKDGSVKWTCEVVWTDARYVGVKFTGLVS
jgi:hypothetical protein